MILYQALKDVVVVDVHQKPQRLSCPLNPFIFICPPGKAVKPLLFVAPRLGEAQPKGVGKVSVALRDALDIVSPPKLLDNTVQSVSLGTFHPVGHNPLESVTA